MKEKLLALLGTLYHETVGALLCFFHHLKNDKKPISEKTVLFVAHPDDDTLFFHTVLKNEKPFVALMTTGKSLRRMKAFRRVMNYYGVNYTFFPLSSRDKREEKLEKCVNTVLSRRSFERAYTHSQSGEYGHEMHKRVHAAVKKCFDGEIFTTVTEEENALLPRLEEELCREKEMIFKTMYTTEGFVLELWPNWLYREKHIPLRRQEK